MLGYVAAGIRAVIPSFGYSVPEAIKRSRAVCRLHFKVAEVLQRWELSDTCIRSSRARRVGALRHNMSDTLLQPFERLSFVL
jgi:hypothetical protein